MFTCSKALEDLYQDNYSMRALGVRYIIPEYPSQLASQFSYFVR